MYVSGLVVDDEITLKSLSVSDAELLWRLIQANHQYLGKHLAWVGDVHDVASTAEFIRQRVGVPGLVSVWYKVYVAGQLCGMFGAKSISGTTAELGCFIAENYQGRGIISRCMECFSDILARDFDVSEIEWRCLPGNGASIRVAERFGAVLKTVETRQISSSGETQRLNVYAKRLT